ncbi:MAG: inorganic diphosphatase [Patescibacteria group bacterium]
MGIKNLKIGDKAPEEINVLIEIPQGSAIKSEIDPVTGELAVDRVIGEADVYPYDYGFIPGTLADDGDALDVIVISSVSAKPKAIVTCRPVAVLEMEDEKGIDSKIICVPAAEAEPAVSGIRDLDDLDLPTRERIELFFRRYKEMENGKWTKVQSFGDKKKALAAIGRAAT